MKRIILMTILFPITVFAGLREEYQVPNLEACQGKVLYNFCYGSRDTIHCEDMLSIVRRLRPPLTGVGMTVHSMDYLISDYRGRYGREPRMSDLKGPKSTKIIFPTEAERACANVIAQGIAMIEYEYKIAPFGARPVVAIQLGWPLSAVPGMIEFWWRKDDWR